MQSELEKTQLEIAKAQLAQEQMKLAKMQRNQKALISMGQGAAVLGEGAARGTGWLIGAVITWVVYFCVASFALAFMLVMKIKNVPGDFLHVFGYYLGLSAHIVIPTLLLVSSVCTVMTVLRVKQDTVGGTFVVGLLIAAGLIIFAV